MSKYKSTSLSFSARPDIRDPKAYVLLLLKCCPAQLCIEFNNKNNLPIISGLEISWLIAASCVLIDFSSTALFPNSNNVVLCNSGNLSSIIN